MMVSTNIIRKPRWIGSLILALALTATSLDALAQSANQTIEEFSGIAALQRGGYTWVAFSSTNFNEALERQLESRIRGYSADVLTGDVDGRTYYRVVFGQFTSRKQANEARIRLREVLPADAWLLVLKLGMKVLPRSEWLPLPNLTYVQPETSVPEPANAIQPDTRPAQTPPRNQASSPLPPAASPVETDEGITTAVEREEADESGKEEEDSLDNPMVRQGFMQRHFEAEVMFSNIYEDNIDHDADFEAVPSFGMVPALHLQLRSSQDDPLIVFDYVVARHSYSNTERWDRVSNMFRGEFEPRLDGNLRMKTSGEISLRGSSEDRDISNQFQVAHEFEYRITRRHRVQLYGTYRIKRFPDQPGVQDFKPNIGFNFERSNSDGERFESGVRYEINREEEERGNYNRWTFDVEYRTPMLNDRDQFEIGVKNRRKSYAARFVEIEDEDFLREDGRVTIDVVWSHRFNRGVSLELGYEFETRSSNDPERLYKANAFNLLMSYAL